VKLTYSGAGQKSNASHFATGQHPWKLVSALTLQLDSRAAQQLLIMAAKPLTSQAGVAEHREKRITSVGQLFGDDLKSSRSIKSLISACKPNIK
jgi:hypothetical protein